MKVDVKFDFFEKRKYIHSTQLLYELLKILKENGYYKENNEIVKIISSYRVMANKQGYYIIDEQYNGNYSTIVTLNVINRTIVAYYVESDEPVTNIIPYDEDSFINNYNLNRSEQSAEITINNEENIYNKIVALNKRLLLSILPTENYSSWVVGKFSIDWNVLCSASRNSVLCIKLHNNLDSIFCRSIIYLNNEAVGYIDYARNQLG